METSNGMSTFKTFNDALLPLSPFSFSDSPPVERHSHHKAPEGANHHRRCSSESFLIEEEQPSWLDDLLNDSETVVYRGHRRAESDSYAYLGEASASLTKGNSLAQMNNQEGEEGESSSAIGNNKQESTTQNLEDKAGGSQAKNSGSKTEMKRSKQQNAYRSRVRKLQYINHLERTLENLKAEGSEVSAELEFVEQQNIILTMENRALRQRLESLSHEQIIKHWEQGMLEREIGRLQSLYNLQKQQQMQKQHHHHYHYQQQQTHNQHPKHRRNGSRDYDYQANMKNKVVTSAKDSVNTPIHV